MSLQLFKLIQFSLTTYEKISVNKLRITFSVPILIGLVIIGQVIMYEIGDVLTIIVDILLSISLWFFYVYCKECVTYFTHTYLNQNEEVRDALIADEYHKKIMFKYNPPMPELKYFTRFRVTDLFVQYTYVLCGYGVQWFCMKKRISSFREAKSFHCKNNLFIFGFLVFTTVFFTTEVILRRTCGLDVINIDNKVNIGGFIQIGNVIMTILFIPRIKSFATTFKAIFPWFDAQSQLSCVILLKMTKLLSTAACGITPYRLGGETEENSKQIMIAMVYSILYLIIILKALMAFNARIIKDYELHEHEAQVNADLIQSLLTSVNNVDNFRNYTVT